MILLQICIGFPVNVFLLLFYGWVASTRHKLSSSALIQTNLALANIMIFLSWGIPETMSAWGWRNFLNVIGCKVLMYFYRVARGLSVCTTCLLSVFQAVTISPSTSHWAGVKTKLPKCIVPSCILSWVLNLLINSGIPRYTSGPRNTSIQITYDLKYCSVTTVSVETTLINTVVYSVWDLLFVGLMGASSSYMVFVLHRHHRQVQHLHGPGRSPKAMPEVRAAKCVISLVTLYILLYGRQTIMVNILINMKGNAPQLMASHLVWSFTFSVFSPFLIIHSDRRMRKFWKRESPVRNMDPS
ncbi:vomeronasal 1 receptor ornAnaV1R3124 [Ornithorhynchus anatinus]|uniref:Vomeronasal type-1 receptor n=1 Tax=Ornithorhynchus anatinus TaxID=9258 RepID=F6SSY2_ORNAN|nr:vomeronasal 1 receptor ornAnaV1R3124 [Ornithorhynchus anatinus]